MSDLSDLVEDFDAVVPPPPSRKKFQCEAMKADDGERCTWRGTYKRGKRRVCRFHAQWTGLTFYDQRSTQEGG